ncbi:MAG TPA: HAMP domain-containing sensor histidine kinase, partial [Lacibacter sp.]|nr:HAMP domain-containing sensor histidine kinase [Lacibacter sp.]
LRIRQLRRIQYRLETLVAQKTQELQRQNTLLEKNDTIKTRLISIISHDIVTPLKFVAAAGRKLVANKAQMSESLQQETIREMTHTAQDLQLLSTNILNWIKYQNKNRRMVQEPVQVKALVDQIMGVLQIMAREKGLELCNETDPALELVQFAEPLRILVYNLLSNAISFSDRGTITVFSTRNEQLVRLHVRDEGIGMMPEQVQNLLSEDYVVVSPGSDQRRGNGLGYLIIKDLLQLMQVGMEIQSEKGKGTEVTLLFLRKQPEETPA